MKHNKVLNRPMFNAQNSAYGRGITANLVSEEQRIRYNSGGRVGLKYGSEWLMKLPGVQKAMKWGASKIPKKLQPGAINPAAWKPGLTQPGFSLPKWTTGKGSGYAGTKWGAGEVPIAKSIAKWVGGKGTGIGKNIQKYPGLWGTGAGGLGLGLSKMFGGEEEEIEEVGGDGQWKEKLQVTKKPTKVDPDSDTLDWTDQEKKEKIGQIQLKLAQRLVGGARDKWGSKAQMKNVGDWFGDVASIGDKTELRKDERKYKAMSKAYKDIAKDAYNTANNYMGKINAGADHPTALYQTTGVAGALKVSGDADKRGDEIEKVKSQGAGTVYFDEVANSWFILTPDGSIRVTVDQIQDAAKSGKLENMAKPVKKTPKVIEEEEKETIEFDPDNPTISQAGIINPDFSKVLLN